MFTPRISYDDLPAPVHAWIETTLGAAVAEHLPQTGGFSPGAAERLVLTDGRRAFCKAVHPSQNEGSAALYRDEIRANAALPTGLPAPRLLASTELDGWVVLLFSDVAGRQPALPWRRDEYEATLAALHRIGAVDATALALPAAGELLADDYTGFARLLADPGPTHPWIQRNLAALAGLAAAAAGRVDGDHLCVVDARADNTLLTSDGAVILDWPWAARGARWLDAGQLAGTAIAQGATFDVTTVTDAWLTARGAEPQALTDVLLGALAFLADATRRPVVPGLESLWAFRARYLDALIPVMAERLDLD